MPKRDFSVFSCKLAAYFHCTFTKEHIWSVASGAHKANLLSASYSGNQF